MILLHYYKLILKLWLCDEIFMDWVKLRPFSVLTALTELSVCMLLTWDSSSFLIHWGVKLSWITLQVLCDRDTETLIVDQALPVGLAVGIHTQLLLGNNTTGPEDIWLHVYLPLTHHTPRSRQTIRVRIRVLRATGLLQGEKAIWQMQLSLQSFRHS